jgi:hypothetical protein
MSITLALTVIGTVASVATAAIYWLEYAHVPPGVTINRLRRIAVIALATLVVAAAAFFSGRWTVADPEHCGVSTSAPAPANVATTETSAPSSVRILEPREGEDVGRPTIVKGRARIGKDADLWVLDLNAEGCFYVKNEKPITVDPKGNWSLPNVLMGREGGLDKGRTYDLYAIIVSREVSSQLLEARSKADSQLQRLPSPRKAEHSVRVTLNA